MTLTPLIPRSIAGPQPLVMVGGVPGAGKSTALATLAPTVPGVRILDSDDERRRLTRIVPGLPYPVLRPLVHLLHHLRVLALLLGGPKLSPQGLIVHDPSTRCFRLAVLGWLARTRGWIPRLVFLDATREQALAGQARRGRVVNRARFDGHWRRWQVMRDMLTGTAERPSTRWAITLSAWAECHLVGRGGAEQGVRRALQPVRLLGHEQRLSVERCLMEGDARR